MVIALSENIVFSKQYGKIDTAFSKAYGVVAYPTMILTKANGIELDRIVGFRPPEKLIPALFDIILNRNTLDDYLTRLAAHPDSFQLRHAVAQRYSERGDGDNAKKHYRYFLDNDPANVNGYNDDALLALGKLEAREKNHDVAVEYFEKLRADYPASELREEAAIWVPYTHMRAADTVEAIRLFEAFKEEFPESEDLEWVDKQITKLKEKRDNQR
jgi:tetratricopeptide (TPR) repeat protein